MRVRDVPVGARGRGSACGGSHTDAYGGPHDAALGALVPPAVIIISLHTRSWSASSCSLARVCLSVMPDASASHLCTWYITPHLPCCIQHPSKLPPSRTLIGRLPAPGSAVAPPSVSDSSSLLSVPPGPATARTAVKVTADVAFGVAPYWPVDPAFTGFGGHSTAPVHAIWLRVTIIIGCSLGATCASGARAAAVRVLVTTGRPAAAQLAPRGHR